MATSVELPEGLEKAVESELDRGLYASKSDLIRSAIRDLLKRRGMIDEKPLSEEAVKSIKRGRNSDSQKLEESGL